MLMHCGDDEDFTKEDWLVIGVFMVFLIVLMGAAYIYVSPFPKHTTKTSDSGTQYSKPK